MRRLLLLTTLIVVASTSLVGVARAETVSTPGLTVMFGTLRSDIASETTVPAESQSFDAKVDQAQVFSTSREWLNLPAAEGILQALDHEIGAHSGKDLSAENVAVISGDIRDLINAIIDICNVPPNTPSPCKPASGSGTGGGGGAPT